MRDFLRFDPQKWIPDSGLNITSRPKLTKSAQSRPPDGRRDFGNNYAKTAY
jgi:hypothetical protein